jgi:probable F420-dependent oxidoreductase
VHIGIKLPSWGPLASFDALTETAQLAERRGYDSVWVSDHVVMPVEPKSPYPFSSDGRPPFDPRTPFLDPFVALAWIGALTTRVQLGTGVLILPLRHPIAVGKQAASVDALAAGRLVLGIGTGWMREEFELLDQDWERRGRRTDEALATLRACWGEDPIDIGSDEFGPLAMSPKPPAGAAVPILVGGHAGPALRRAARLADGWYGSNVGPETFEALAADVRRQRSDTGSVARFTVGIKAPLAPPSEAAEQEKAYTEAGADFVVFDLDYASEALDLRSACQVIDAIADELGLDERTPSPIGQ